MPKPLSIQDALKVAAGLLAPHGGAAALETEILLAHVLAKPRSHLRAWPEQMLQESSQRLFFDLIARRAAGEPIAYLTGQREFWSLPLAVNLYTLIPRPETELLVQLALARIPLDRDVHVADLGTGSGAIALAIASERPRCRIIATDLCPHALKVARANAERLDIANVEFREGSWFTPLTDGRFDIIVSNPPYVAENDPHLAEGDLPAEPSRALVAGPTGLEMISAIVNGASHYLREEGWLLIEHGYDQGKAAAALLRETAYRELHTWRDAAGHERVSGGQRS